MNMPFGPNKWPTGKMFNFKETLDVTKRKYPGIHKVRENPNDASKTYWIPGFAGRVGFITSMTENFCASRNRLRMTSDGNLKVCLFGNSEVSLRDVLRGCNGGRPIDADTIASHDVAATSWRCCYARSSGPRTTLAQTS